MCEAVFPLLPPVSHGNADTVRTANNCMRTTIKNQKTASVMKRPLDARTRVANWRPRKSIKPALCLVLGLVGLLTAFAAVAQAPKLLPFQGRLTDQNGAAIPDGLKLVQFKIFDVPTGGASVWPGEVHQATVNGGLVNVLLGTKTLLSGVDFNKQLYLEITVDINGDNMITVADPPLLPRQVILPVVFAQETATARNATKLAGHDWSDLLVSGNDPSDPFNGQIKGTKIQNQSISVAQLAPWSVTADQIKSNTITADQLALQTITSNQISPGSISVSNLNLQALVDAITTLIIPPGTINAFGGTNVPGGWLLCDGRAISSAQYPKLYAAISTNWGFGIQGSSTNFNLPDLRGQFLRGADSLPDAAFAPANVNVASGIITVTNHGINRIGYPVRLSNTGGSLPGGLSVNTTYYVIVLNANSFRLASTRANAFQTVPVTISSQGSGTHTLISYVDPDKSSRFAFAPGGTTTNLVGSAQNDDLISHDHENKMGGVNDRNISCNQYENPCADKNDSLHTQSYTWPYGGSETRPKNMYVNYIIKY